MMPRYPTLTDLFHDAGEAPQSIGFTFLSSAAPVHLAYADLWRDAVALAGSLQDLGVRRGSRVILTVPTGPEFTRIFVPLQLCGAASCVLPQVSRAQAGASGVQRIVSVARAIGTTALICRDDDGEALANDPQSPPVWTVSSLAALETKPWRPVPQSRDDIAVIQATSGSTDEPKRVLLSHANVLSNLEQIGQRIDASPADDTVVSWLPLFHDMGLIGGFLFPLYWQMRSVLMDPFRFLRDPANWLRAISEFHGTISSAPNFAYALAAQQKSDAVPAGIDLASWRVAICGGEPISPAVLRRFAARFGASGFHPEALAPSYGLAEASLCVTMHAPGHPFVADRVSRDELTQQHKAVQSTDLDDEDVATFCDCGQAVEGTQLRVVSADGHPLPDGHVGAILISGPSVTAGYEGPPQATGLAIRDGWLWTGDQGYLREGRLFVTGRIKDLIIVRGQNYPPTEFEWAAEEVPGVRQGRVAAFGVEDPGSGTELLYVICERVNERDGDTEALRTAIQAQIARRTGVWPTHVGLVPRNAVPRTTSGKLQRSLAKANFLAALHQPEMVPS